MTTGDDQQQERRGISHHDWAADAESRVQRWSLAAPRPAGSRMVLSRLAALRPISQASPMLARSLATPLPLVLRMLPRQAAEPMMTIQSPSAIESETISEPVAPPPVSSMQAAAPEAALVHDEPAPIPPEVDTPEPRPARPTPPAAEAPSTSLIGSAIGALRRVFRRPEPVEAPPEDPEPVQRPSPPSATPTPPSATVSRQEQTPPDRASTALDTPASGNQASLTVEDAGAATRESSNTERPSADEAAPIRMPASPSTNLVLRQPSTDTSSPMRSATESPAPVPPLARLEATPPQSAPITAAASQPEEGPATVASERASATPPEAAAQPLALAEAARDASPMPLSRSEDPAPLDSVGRATESEPEAPRAAFDAVEPSPTQAPAIEAPRPAANRLMLSLRRLFDGDRDAEEAPAAPSPVNTATSERAAQIAPSPMATSAASAPSPPIPVEAPHPAIESPAPTISRALTSEVPAADAIDAGAFTAQPFDRPALEQRPQLTLRQNSQHANSTGLPTDAPDALPTQSQVETSSSAAQPMLAREEAPATATSAPSETPAFADSNARSSEEPSATDAAQPLGAFAVEDQDESSTAFSEPTFEAPSLSRFTLARRESASSAASPALPLDTTSDPILRATSIPPRPDDGPSFSTPSLPAETPAPAQRVRTGLDPVVLRSMQARPFEPASADSSDIFAPIARQTTESAPSSPPGNDSPPSTAAWPFEQRQASASTPDWSSDEAPFSGFDGVFSGFASPGSERTPSLARAPLSLVYRAARPAGADAWSDGSSDRDPMSSLDQWVAAAELGSSTATRPAFAGASAMQTLSASSSMIHRQIGDEAAMGGDGTVADSAGGAPSAESPAAPAEEGAAQGPSLESLAQEVYERLRRRLIVERERSGVARAYA